MTYVDASVVLRVVLSEPEPIADLGSAQLVSSEIIRVECLRTVDRARLTFPGLETETAGQRADVLSALATLALVPLSTAILDRAGDPFPTSLGSLDAIHLATALRLRDEFPDLVFATHDRELGLAARSMGFEVMGV